MSLMKWIAVLCATGLVACQSNKSADGSGGGGAGPGAPQAAVKMGSKAWDVKSVLAISRAGYLTLYFLPAAGFDCAHMQEIANAEAYVTVTLPNQSKSYDLQGITEIAQSGISAAFVESRSSAQAFEQIILDLTVNGVDVSGSMTGSRASGETFNGPFHSTACAF